MRSTPVVVTSEITPIWGVQSGAIKYQLAPQDDVTTIELYRISEWKEWAQSNPHLEGKPERAFKKAKELGILRHFQQIKRSL